MIYNYSVQGDYYLGIDYTQARSETPDTADFIPVKRLFSYQGSLMLRAEIFISIMASAAILLGLAYWRTGEFGDAYRLLAVFSSLVMFIIYKLLGVFRQSRGRILEVLQITKAWAVTIFIVLSLGFITKTTHEFSRLVIGSWITVGYLVQIAGFLISFRLTQKYYIHFGETLRTLVVGSNLLAKHLVDSLNKNIWSPDLVVGVVDNSPNGQDQDH